MSESDRMPGYLNRSHVPPLASRASRTATLLVGTCSRTWQAAPMPERPAPTMRTSTCSGEVTSRTYVSGRRRSPSSDANGSFPRPKSDQFASLDGKQLHEPGQHLRRLGDVSVPRAVDHGVRLVRLEVAV